MQTERDSQIVSWVGGLGAAGAEHVMSEFGMSRSIAYQRLNSLTRDGLLEHHTVLYGRPGMYTATLAGLRWKGIGHLGTFSVRPGSFEHAWQVAHTAVQLGRAMPDWEVMSERQLRSAESEYGKLLASIQVGRATAGAKLHRPDLVLICKRGLVIPIEVELSTKSASRLAAICRGWARARHINTVYYLAAPGPARAVTRAVRSTNAGDRIQVLGLDDIPTLANEQYVAEDKFAPTESMDDEDYGETEPSASEAYQ
ncbi:MAG TPA: hypothetical protein VGP18_10400 [Solirubrobacteraceae bacterium]|jgi:hypothetical protein|nr:hypothetical protein [Solirubrobacteraceae bacterium]